MVQVANARVLSALLLVALALACTRAVPLAVLEGRALTESDFRRHLASLYPVEEEQRILKTPARRQVELERWFDVLAIAAKARRLGIDNEPRFRKAVELMEMRTLAHRLTEENRERIESVTRITDDEVQRFYQEHKGDYLSPPSFTARQLLVYVRGNPAFPERGLGEPEARAKALRALAELRSGQSWDAVARRFSDDLSNHQKGGLIRDGRFGLFATEVEQAVRTQDLGKPGGLVRSIFGYHILQVESRNLDERPEPLAQVEPLIRERLSAAHAVQAHKVFVEPIASEMGLKILEAGTRDSSLLDENAVAADEVLAEIGARKIHESDFRWFLKDVFPVSQRTAVFSRPGARHEWLASFLDELVLEAKARREGLDSKPDFLFQRMIMQQNLLTEFLLEHDRIGRFCQCQLTSAERQAAERRYLDDVRSEVGLRPTALTGAWLGQ